MPRLSVEDASAAGAAMVYALSTLPQDAPQRLDWEQALHRLQQRLDVALSQHAQGRARHLPKLTAKAHPSRGHRPVPAPCALKAVNALPERLHGCNAAPCPPMNPT